MRRCHNWNLRRHSGDSYTIAFNRERDKVFTFAVEHGVGLHRLSATSDLLVFVKESEVLWASNRRLVGPDMSRRLIYGSHI